MNMLRYALAAIVLGLGSASVSGVGPASHGVGLSTYCEGPKAVGDTLECFVQVQHYDDFGDTLAILAAWDVVDPWPGGANVRVPAVGDLEIVAAWGNTDAYPGATLPVHIGPPGSTLHGLPGADAPGVVVFVQNSYTITLSDRDPLFDQCHVIVQDMCDGEQGTGCSTYANELQFTAAADVIHPAVSGAVAVPPAPICAGQSTEVAWDVHVSVPPEGDTPLVNLSLAGGACDDAVRLQDAYGDDDDVLDPGEVWAYRCVDFVDDASTEMIYVHAEDLLGGYLVTDEVPLTVELATPPEPTIGDPGDVCVGDTLALSGGPAGMSSYTWTGPGGLTSTDQNPVFPVAVPGSYCLTVTDAQGCEGQTCFTPDFFDNPTAQIAVDGTPVCTTVGNTATVSVSGGAPPYAYAWSIDGNGWGITGDASGDEITYAAGDDSEGGLYVLVTDQNGCRAEAFMFLACTEATGACCVGGDACIATTEAGCLDAGGTYHGDFSACSAELCLPASGACCLSFGPCNIVTDPDLCAAAGGVYQGDGTDCSVCPPAEAACCLPDGCQVLTADACAVAGGDWNGEASCNDACPPPTGACCLPAGDCVNLDETACLVNGGAFRGPGTTCDDEPCLGACCLQDGSCQESSADACDAAGGVYGGPDATCASRSCPAPGGCCFDDGSCRSLLPIDCVVAGGLFAGEGVPCEEDLCVAAIVSCCDGDAESPRVLSFRYTADGCGTADHGQGGDASCSGSETLPGVVRIVSTDQAPPYGNDVSTWFDDVVAVDERFAVDALNMDLQTLGERTWIVIEDVDTGEALQTIAIETTCGMPLQVGNSFGGVRLEQCSQWHDGPGGGGPSIGDCPGADWLEPLMLPQWPEPFRPETPFDAVFENTFPGMSLLEVAQAGGTELLDAGGGAVKALLDAAHPGVLSNRSVGGVVSLFSDSVAAGDFEELSDIDDDIGHGCIVDFGLLIIEDKPACPVDLDGSGVVDEADLVVALQHWGQCPDGCPADLTGDGAVGPEDLIAIVVRWGDCP